MTGGVANLDDFSACKISQKQDWRDLFVTPFYFGCEADDPSNVWAFNTRANPLGARLNAIFSSDIGHFDVPDKTEVVPEAYEMVEDDGQTEIELRDVTQYLCRRHTASPSGCVSRSAGGGFLSTTALGLVRPAFQ